ncbi:hypothetical protein Pyn_00821 [Prunus yedoensis var. nudiflora]|uniref:Uncharacterized protein n=1 Tax=Prunus yedoensis var. nudiflora TaxID=2094558 RepID=A0A314Z847_PRUYE|nr:hypothetical protein Pyn_00821 [Prunus yedoensis var. nudiflora]
MDRGRKGGKKMVEKVELPSEAAAGRGLEHTKSLILWIWQDWLCQHEGLSYPAKTTIQLTIFREQAFSLENPANFRALLAYFLHLPYFGKIATVPTETLPSCRKLRKPPKALSLGTSPLFH